VRPEKYLSAIVGRQDLAYRLSGVIAACWGCGVYRSPGSPRLVAVTPRRRAAPDALGAASRRRGWDPVSY
jgi:hypothetical protein